MRQPVYEQGVLAAQMVLGLLRGEDVQRAITVPTQLVIYPDEGHGIRELSHRRDILRRTAGWLDRYLKDGGAPGSGGPP